MSRVKDRKQRRVKIKRRFRTAVRGTADRPRLSVYRSLRHVYAQVIDDDSGTTIASASSKESAVKGDTLTVDVASKVGELVGARAKDAGITTVVFDRGGFKYHGRVQALAEAAREAGLDF